MLNLLISIILLEDHQIIAHLKKEKISFCDPQHEDRDHLVKSCCLMMIATVSEAQCGIEKL